MIYIKVFSQFIFYLIGTFLHEFAHYTLAVATLSTVPKMATVEEEDVNGNKIQVQKKGFTIIPEIKTDKIVYGHVLAIPKLKVAFVLISIAPLIWIVVLYYMLAYFNYLNININNGNIYFEFNYIKFFVIKNWLIIYMSLQLLWAGTLSPQDMKMFFSGLFSISSLLIISVVLLTYDFFNNHILLNFIQGYINV
ncbi:MAG: hypothetical protein QM503_05285 [Bacteroidota bacterium]